MRRKAAQGVTLVEMVVSCSVTALLLAVAFAFYEMGQQAWRKSHAKTELLQVTQVLTSKLTREIEASTFYSATASADQRGIAFQSAFDTEGRFRYDPVRILPEWQNYVVYFFDPQTKTVQRKQVPTASASPSTVTQPIDSLGDGPVENYFSDGQPVARNLEECTFVLNEERQLVVEMTAVAPARGSSAPTRQQMRLVTSFRN